MHLTHRNSKKNKSVFNQLVGWFQPIALTRTAAPFEHTEVLDFLLKIQWQNFVFGVVGDVLAELMT